MAETIIFVAVCVAGIGFLACVFVGLCRESIYRSILGPQLRASGVVVQLSQESKLPVGTDAEQLNAAMAEPYVHDGVAGDPPGWQILVNPRRLRA